MHLQHGSMLVAPEPLAADTSAEIFAEGGNAVDAAIAVAFAQGVVNPTQCGIGGNGAMTVYLSERRLTLTIDFGEVVGSRAHPTMWYADFLGQVRPAGRYLVRGNANTLGYQAIAVPGFVRGMQAAWETFGSLPWPRLLAPATRLAVEGFPVYPYLERSWRRTGPPYLDGGAILTATSACAAIYTKGGMLLEVGDLLTQPEMARTLQTIADEGPDDFYQGSIGAQIAEDFARNDALITREDLVRYRARSSPPLTFTYRRHRLVSELPPGSGLQLAEMLAILEGFDLQALGWNSPEYIRVLAETMKIGFADKVRYLGDPDFAPVPTGLLLSAEYVQNQRRRIHDREKVTVPLIPGTAPDAPSLDNATRVERITGTGTTHLSVVDSRGNAVSLTHSICSSSGVVTPGLGFMYNNCMDQFCPNPEATPNPIMPGRRRATGSCATIVFRGEDPFLVIGGSGGNSIPTSVLQTILNVVDHGMPVQAAVHAARIHCEGGIIEVEAPVSTATCQALKGMGYEVNRKVLSFSETFGCVQAIQIGAQGGERSAGADPRGGGGIAYLLQ